MNDSVVSGSGEPQLGQDEQMPTTTFICGRGRVGKTTISTTFVQFVRQYGARLEVWNGDMQNQTASLKTFHADASSPATDDPDERRLWLESNLRRQVQQRFDAVLDTTGGDSLVRQLGREIGLVELMERYYIRSVAWHVLGPDPADLDYLRMSMEAGIFMPEATVLVLNTGLLTNGRAAQSVFADIITHEVVSAALAKGAKMLWFPRLICMRSVMEQGILFQDAALARYKPTQTPLDMFNEARVGAFWNKDVPAFFSDVPRLWLPRMPGRSQ